MAKSKTTTSKVKLSNKSTNKRMKSKRKHKLNKTNTPKTLLTLQNMKKNEKSEKKKKNPNESQLSFTRTDYEVDEQLSDGDLAFSDEEMLDYVHENSINMTLFSTPLNNNNNKLKKKSDEEYADYENVPRSFSKSSDTGATNGKVELLPLKGDKGLIQRSRDVDDVLIEKVDNGLPEDTEPAVNQEENVDEKPLSAIEVIANYRADVNMKKMKIAQLSQDIIEDPDKVNGLKELVALCVRKQPMAVRKLSLLSLVEVFKDIIPSYRIRELTEQERAIKVSRDVCKLREFENAILSNYQAYLTQLEENIKDCLKVVKKHQKHGLGDKSTLQPMLSLATISSQCLCELLKCVPHFNFRSNIIAVVVPKMECTGDLAQLGKICFDGIKAALIADRLGDVTLEIIKVVNKVVKSKIHVKPKLLEVLLYLQINSDAIRSAKEKGNKMERLRKKREAIMKMSKKEKKKKKFEDQLNKEMQEAEAVENKDKLERMHTEILKFLFVIYFRVLKADHISSLLPVVLQGLAKFAHLINVEFFTDLMTAIERILKTEDVGLNASLNCIKTAMRVLSGQGEILTIDPKQFYTELYTRLLLVSADGVEGEIAMAKSCAEDMILKRKKQVSIVTVIGFFKRLSTILLQLKADNVVEYCMLVRSILQTYKKCDLLLDNDTCSRGVFQPEVDDPEYCNAESATLWELCLLTQHYHPHMNVVGKHVLNGAPSQGMGALPARFTARTANKTTDDLHIYFPEFIPSKPCSKTSINSNANKWTNATFERSAIEGFTTTNDVDVDQVFPVAKRKKCTPT